MSFLSSLLGKIVTGMPKKNIRLKWTSKFTREIVKVLLCIAEIIGLKSKWLKFENNAPWNAAS